MNSALREPRWSDVNIVRIGKLMLVIGAPVFTGMEIRDGSWGALGMMVANGLFLSALIGDVRTESSRSPRTEGADT